MTHVLSRGLISICRGLIFRSVPVGGKHYRLEVHAGFVHGEEVTCVDTCPPTGIRAVCSGDCASVPGRVSAAAVAVPVLLVGVCLTSLVIIHSWPGVAVGGVQKA